MSSTVCLCPFYLLFPNRQPFNLFYGQINGSMLYILLFYFSWDLSPSPFSPEAVYCKDYFRAVHLYREKSFLFLDSFRVRSCEYAPPFIPLVVGIWVVSALHCYRITSASVLQVVHILR